MVLTDRVSNYIFISIFYTSFKRTVHLGNSQNKRLLLDPSYFIFHSVVSAFLYLACLKKATGEASVCFQNRWGGQFACKKFDKNF